MARDIFSQIRRQKETGRRARKTSPSRGREIVPVNPNDANRTKHRYVLWFGAYGNVRLLILANSLDDALDEAIDWLAENAPGHIVDDQVEAEYKRILAEKVAEGADPEDEDVVLEAQEEAEEDTTSGGNYGNRIMSHEWGIVAEDPTREELLRIEGRPPERRTPGKDPLASRKRGAFSKRSR